MTYQTPLIETNRFFLTVLKPNKADLVHEYYLRNKERLAPFEPLRSDSFYHLNSCEKRLEKSFSCFQNGQAVNFVAITKDHKYMLGMCNFTGIAMGPFMACYLGFSIDKDFEGKGLMAEILRTGIEHMFAERKLHRIMANYLPENSRSKNLLEKLGFKKEGYARSYLKIAGIWQDHILNSLINPCD